MKNKEENGEKIWKIWKKSQFNIKMNQKIWKKDKLISKKIWKIWKKRRKTYEKYGIKQ